MLKTVNSPFSLRLIKMLFLSSICAIFVHVVGRYNSAIAKWARCGRHRGKWRDHHCTTNGHEINRNKIAHVHRSSIWRNDADFNGTKKIHFFFVSNSISICFGCSRTVFSLSPIRCRSRQYFRAIGFKSSGHSDRFKNNFLKWKIAIFERQKSKAKVPTSTKFAVCESRAVFAPLRCGTHTKTTEQQQQPIANILFAPRNESPRNDSMRQNAFSNISTSRSKIGFERSHTTYHDPRLQHTQPRTAQDICL